MNKKVIRIFIAVCLMLAMTTTTAFAAVRTSNRSFTYYIYNNGHHDFVTHNKDNKAKKFCATVNGTLQITYNTKTKDSKIVVKNLTFTGENSSRYYYNVKTWGRPGYIHVVLSNEWAQTEDIGFLLFKETKYGHFRESCHNYRGPH